MAGPSSAPPPGPEFVPGELLNIESTMEDGRYESESQERGTYTQSSSNVERGRDDWQENRYIRYDYPTEDQEQLMQSYSQYSDQSYQPVEPVGPGKGKMLEQQFPGL
ncbi:unnamed protein product [Arctogadus glacialis]